MRYKPLEGDETDDGQPFGLFHLIISTGPISWGEPADICLVTMDKACPRCDMERENDFDLGIEDGQIFGARCAQEVGGCGWSFGKGGDEGGENTQAENQPAKKGVRRRLQKKKVGKSKPRMGRKVPVKRTVAEVQAVVSGPASAVRESAGPAPTREGGTGSASHSGPCKTAHVGPG